MSDAGGCDRVEKCAVRIRIEPADQLDVIALIEALDGYQQPLYPADSHHGVDVAELAMPNVLFAVARTNEGEAVGCGAVVLSEEHGEIKRMFVNPSMRRQGVGKRLLAFLEARAVEKGCSRFVLETGYLQSEALSLYLRGGYIRCGPFGEYAEDANSVFMCKDVD